MKKHWIRHISLLLVLILVASLPFSALAADSDKKDALKITPPKTSAAVVGNVLKNVTLTGGSAKDASGNDVSGTFAWQYPKTVLEAYGYYVYPCVFTPDDTQYPAQICYPAVHVYRTSLTVAELPTVANSITVGQAISEAELTGGVAHNYFQFGRPAIPGKFQWVDEDETFDGPGEYSRAVVFVPEDEVTYNRATVTYTRNADRTFANAYVVVKVTDK